MKNTDASAAVYERLADALDALPRDEYVRLLRIEAGDVSLRSWIGQHFAQNGLSCA